MKPSRNQGCKAPWLLRFWISEFRNAISQDLGIPEYRLQFQLLQIVAAPRFRNSGSAASRDYEIPESSLHLPECIAPLIPWVFRRPRILPVPGSACLAGFRNSETGAGAIPKSGNGGDPDFDRPSCDPGTGRCALDFACLRPLGGTLGDHFGIPKSVFRNSGMPAGLGC